MFKFSNNKMIKSLRKIQFQVNTPGVSVTITNDVVAYNIPLVLYEEAIKKPILNRFSTR